MLERPNVLLIHCHDLGDLISCYPGNVAQTPNLARLAEEGVVFNNAFSCAPQCSPSRAGMYTGLHPCRHGLMGLANKGVWNLDPEVPNLVGTMRRAGYWTAQVGIFHIGGDPSAYGFEVSRRLVRSEEVVRAAINVLESRPTEKPFFAVVGTFEPHRPYRDTWQPLLPVDRIIVPPYLTDCLAGREELARFYGEVSHVDAAVGRLLDWLDRTALEDETLVVFTTDHGIAMPLAKGTLYDPGLKIALLLRWPGIIPQSRRIDRLVSNVDLFPSIVEAVGAQDHLPLGLDGRSFWPAATGATYEARQQVFAEITWHDFYQPMRSIRTETHKLIWNVEPGKGLKIPADVLRSPFVAAVRETLRNWPRPEYELYDLRADPWERHNLAGQAEVAEVERELRARLQARLAFAKDPILEGPVEPVPGYMDVFSHPGGLP